MDVSLPAVTHRKREVPFLSKAKEVSMLLSTAAESWEEELLRFTRTRCIALDQPWGLGSISQNSPQRGKSLRVKEALSGV